MDTFFILINFKINCFIKHYGYGLMGRLDFIREFSFLTVSRNIKRGLVPGIFDNSYRLSEVIAAFIFDVDHFISKNFRVLTRHKHRDCKTFNLIKYKGTLNTALWILIKFRPDKHS